MLTFIILHQWGIFIGLEIFSFILLLIFFILRYAFRKQKLSRWFLGLFISCIFLEGILAVFVYRETGEISTFQIVVLVFIVYACTLGISDFRKLDLFIKRKVGDWRGIELLTDEDWQRIERNKDPRYQAKQNRYWWYGHALVFMIAHFIFWLLYGNPKHSFIYFVSDLSWLGDAEFGNGPFQHEMIDSISKLWLIIFAVDTIVSWSYTLFPSKRKK